VPKFELYEHNDELFNIYYGIFYELWTFTNFDRLCKLEKRGMKFKKSSSLKLLSQSQPNFAEMILRWSPFKILSISAVLYPRCPPWLKNHISIISAKFGWDWLNSFREDFFKFHPPFFLICIIGKNRQNLKVHKKSRNIC
jgi:hypothetical protein